MKNKENICFSFRRNALALLVGTLLVAEGAWGALTYVQVEKLFEKRSSFATVFAVTNDAWVKQVPIVNISIPHRPFSSAKKTMGPHQTF